MVRTPANVVERGALQFGVGLGLEQALAQISAPGLQGGVDLAQALLQQTHIDIRLPKPRRTLQTQAIGVQCRLGLTQALLQGTQIEQGGVSQVRVSVGVQPQLIGHTGLFGEALAFQLVGLLHQFGQRPASNQRLHVGFGDGGRRAGVHREVGGGHNRG